MSLRSKVNLLHAVSQRQKGEDGAPAGVGCLLNLKLPDEHAEHVQFCGPISSIHQEPASGVCCR